MNDEPPQVYTGDVPPITLSNVQQFEVGKFYGIRDNETGEVVDVLQLTLRSKKTIWFRLETEQGMRDCAAPIEVANGSEHIYVFSRYTGVSSKVYAGDFAAFPEPNQKRLLER